jgi:hypothetical protein
MNTQFDKRRLGVALVASSLAMLAGCNTLGTAKTEEPRAAAPAVGRVEAITLSGRNQVPPVTTSASGTGSVTVGRDRNVTAKVTVTGMTATAAHIHEGAAGANGKVIVPFVKTGDNTFAAAPGAKMDEAQYEAWKAGRTYVNVHSAAHPGGEVRAQLKGDK